MKYNFSGYATKFNVKCTDGRIIKPEAFKHNDGIQVPLVWQHGHDNPTNVIGHALLEHRDDGIYAYGVFNDTAYGQHTQALIEHDDVNALSIFANQLKEQALVVTHGNIKEISVVLAGANPGALIDYVSLAHGELSNSEACIYTSEDDASLSHEGGEVEIKHAKAKDSDVTVAEIFDGFTDIQKDVVYAMVAEAAGEKGNLEQKQKEDKILQHILGGNVPMKKNIFDKSQQDKVVTATLSHSDFQEIFKNARKNGSLKEAVLAHLDLDGNEKKKESYLMHAGTYGIDNLDVLFPDAQNVMSSPEFDKRRTEWVSGVLSGVHKVPFSRIKSMYADITADEARAKGYIKGDEKIEEVFPLFKRTTDPFTIYKKQKLDRDDIIDITDYNIVIWLKSEMRLMLDEELARAILVGDGRTVDNREKIDETKIRPIYTDDAKYSIKFQLASDATGLDELEQIMKAMDDYKGSGVPNFYTTRAQVTKWKLLKDSNGHYRFRNTTEIADFIGVKSIIDVEIMKNLSRDIEETEHDLIGIVVNLRDYTVGADKGGKVSTFDDFDIDFNQQKYLIETRCSGALTKLYSALVVEKAQAAG